MDKLDFWDDLNKPKWMDSYSYLTVMGSRAYGSATEDSDYDFYGFVVPPQEVVFPYLVGDIPGFGKQKNVFNQLQIQGAESETYGDVDITIYNIVRYFHLVMQNNPNMIDSLFVPDSAIVYADEVGKLVRYWRHDFLSQKLWHTFKGMAWSHMKRITSRTREGKRKNYVEKYGYDVKDASHVVRLLGEVNDFLFTGDCDISSRGEKIREVRSGQFTLDEIKKIFDVEMDMLEHRMSNGESVLPQYPDQVKIKTLLVYCLEEKYGSLSKIGWNRFGD